MEPLWTYLRRLGHHWKEAALTGAIPALVGIGFSVADHEVPRTLWVIPFGVGLVVAQYRAYRDAVSDYNQIALALSQVEAVGERRDQIRDVRDSLGELIAEGDRLAGRITREANEIELDRLSYPHHPAREPEHDWWGAEYAAWLREVRHLLEERPELGMAYVTIFNANEGIPGIAAEGMGSYERMRQTIAAITEQQRRLSGFMREFMAEERGDG